MLAVSSSTAGTLHRFNRCDECCMRRPNRPSWLRNTRSWASDIGAVRFIRQFLVLQPQLADVGFAMMADAVRGATMVQTTRAWARELERLHARISHHFRRAEPRRRSLAYLKALAAS